MAPFFHALYQSWNWPSCENLVVMRKVVTESPERNPKSSARLSSPQWHGQPGRAEPQRAKRLDHQAKIP
jgi:hypothetical protein